MKYSIKLFIAKILGDSQILGKQTEKCGIVDLIPKKILNFLENVTFCIFLTRFHKYTFFYKHREAEVS